ncbi:unnamed protein product [Adineta steineri]|nr:unnamed protein product [Adineta steineri]CAF3939770.1 unnamed protein product [Adineta steineri]
MKWSAIIASFILPHYLCIYFIVFFCWFMADWTCIIARMESKLHPQPYHRSFLVRVSQSMRIIFACLGLVATIRHIFFK